MKYKYIIIGILLLVTLFVPIYYTTGHCCGHAYDEEMTIIKHFILGQDSCLVLGYESYTPSLLYLVGLILSIWLICKGFEKKEKKHD